MHLDSKQMEIVNSNESQILVIAGSGSGKTRVLTERIKRLINDGVPTDGIVVITFTNAAADEIKERLEYVGEAFIGTIHGYANRILLRNGINTKEYIEKEDFDQFFQIIKARKVPLPYVEHLLVDEYQDVDPRQFEFFKLLSPANFFAVGDDLQSIYAFRGSDVSIFLDLANDKKTKVFYLETNYRSGAEIVDFANHFIEPIKNKIEKNAYCVNYGGEVITMKSLNLDFILDTILSVDSFQDWFIITRTNAQIDMITDFLQKNEIPCETFKKSELDNHELRDKLKANTIKVLTAHSAKGLENRNVVALGIKPYWDEERRVAYVAATRAMNLLIWVFSTKQPQKKNNIEVFEF